MIHFRKDTSDQNVLKDVLQKHCYRRRNIGFDVEKGEHWLDLGAHIGAFALYCEQRGATAECYEPDPDTYKVLVQNIPTGCRCYNRAVSISRKPFVSWYKPADEQRYSGRSMSAGYYVWRGGRYKQVARRPAAAAGIVSNMYAGDLKHRFGFDGVKIDIEGGEGPLLDRWLIPHCKKLVVEYHPTYDPSVKHLARRLQNIHKHFTHCLYPPSYDCVVESGEKTINSFPVLFYNRLIFAWND